MWQNSNTMPAYICNYGNNVLSNRIESGACGKKHFSLETGKYKIAIVGNCELKYLTQKSVPAMSHFPACTCCLMSEGFFMWCFGSHLKLD